MSGGLDAQSLQDMRERADDLIADRDKGWIPLADWGPKCRGCGADEYRIDGYCSCECRDWHTDDEAADVARDVLVLLDERERLEASLADVELFTHLPFPVSSDERDLWRVAQQKARAALARLTVGERASLDAPEAQQ